MCESGLFSWEIMNTFFVGQVSELVKNLNIGIYSDIITVINVKLCMMVVLMMVVLIEIYLSYHFQ